VTRLSGKIRERVYGDFLMPSRLAVYRALLETALGAGYKVVSIEGFWALIKGGSIDPAGRYLVLRNDIDTGPRTARAMWAIERSLGIASSYFFRLSSLDLALMADIGGAGGEASYHYEELATVAKRRHLRTPAEALQYLPEAQDLFRVNLDRLRASSGQPIRIVASHGDFVNRKLGLTNWLLLADERFRAEVGIELETYDAAFMDHVTSRHADLTNPPYWTPADPLTAIARDESVIYVLVHPRSWQVERGLNARDDLVRAWQSLRYALPGLPSSNRSKASPPAGVGHQ
jgi:hypothetical protein